LFATRDAGVGQYIQSERGFTAVKRGGSAAEPVHGVFRVLSRGE